MCRVEGPISEADVETVVDLILLEQSLGKKISSKSDLLHLDKYQVIRLGYLGNFLCCQTKSHLNTDRYVFNARNLWSLVPKQLNIIYAVFDFIDCICIALPTFYLQ